ncbi:MAG: FAD-binding oxidoreductase [Chloroflexota bacterium]
MLPANTADVVIIGGGVMGASAAYHLAKRGGRNIILLEREPFFGTGATGRCAGGVRYQFGTQVNVRLSIESLRMLEHFKEEIGQEINYRKCGYLFVLTDERHAEVFRHNVAMQRTLGVNTEWFSGEEVRRRLPLMSFGDALAGTFNPQDGLVDPNSVVSGYVTAAQRLGVRLVTNSGVLGIEVRGGRVQGVETHAGTVASPVVVDAAGPWAGQVARMAGVELPITPIRRQWFTTSPLPELPPDFPFVIDFAQSLYFHREGEGLLIGMSNQNEVAGYNQTVDEEFELINAEAAIRRLPLVERAGRASHGAGLYEVTPDAHPILGVTPVEGLMIVAGFSGHGFMHGPIAGKLMAELILDGRYSTLDVTMLDLARFEEQRLIREYNVV